MLEPASWMDTAPEDDAVFHDVIAPWLDRQHRLLTDYDAQRPGTPWYVFHDHVMRVADMGLAFALFLGASRNAATWYYHALRVHDCGKTLLPVSIWDSESKPTDAVKNKRRSHAPLGAQMIETDLPSDHPFTAFAADIARHHHAQMDGKGFLGVNAANLSSWVRAACIVDSYDGMSVWRPHYGDRDITPQAVYQRLSVEKGAEVYDGELLKAFGEFLD